MRLCGQMARGEKTDPEKVILYCFFIAAAALKTPTRSGYNAQGANLNMYVQSYIDTYDTHTHTYNYMCMRLCGQMARDEATDAEELILYGGVLLLPQQRRCFVHGHSRRNG